MPQVDAQKNKTLAQKVLEKGLRFKRAYKKAKEELEAAKTREIALQRQLQDQQDLVAQLRAQNTTLESKSSQDAATITGLTSQAQHKDSELETLQTDLAEKERALTEQSQRLTSELKTKEAELGDLREQSLQDAERIADLTCQAQTLELQAEVKEVERRELEDRITKHEEKEMFLFDTNNKLETKNNELAEQVENLRELIGQLMQVLAISKPQDNIHSLFENPLVSEIIKHSSGASEVTQLRKENVELHKKHKDNKGMITTLTSTLERERKMRVKLVEQEQSKADNKRETKAESTEDEILRKENQDLQQRLKDNEDIARELIQELEQMSQEMEVLKVQQSSVSAIEIDADDEVLVENKKEVKSKLAEPLDPLKIHNERIKQIAQRIDYIRTPQFNRLFKKLEKLDLRLVGNVRVLSTSLNRFRAALEETVENQFEAKALYLSQLLKLQMLDIQMQTEKNKKTKDQLQKQRVKLFKEIMEEMKEQVSKARYLDSEKFLENLDSSSSWSALQKIKALVAWNEKSLEKEREYMQNRNGFITSESDKKYAEFISSAESLLGQLLTTVQDIQNALVDIDLSGIEIQRKKKVHKTKRPEIAPKTSSVIIPIPPRPPAPPENQKRVVSSTRSDDDNRAKKVAVAAPVDLLSQIQAGGVPLRDSKARELASAAPKPKTVWDGIEEKIKDKFQNTLSDSEDETDDWSSDEEYGSSGDEARQSSELPLGANPAILLSSPSGQHTVSSSAQPAPSPPSSPH